jgi:hypothetical protein
MRRSVTGAAPDEIFETCAISYRINESRGGQPGGGHRRCDGSSGRQNDPNKQAGIPA